ncbi:MAG TPA: TIGR04551 family protein [Polyangiales bacterium]
MRRPLPLRSFLALAAPVVLLALGPNRTHAQDAAAPAPQPEPVSDAGAEPAPEPAAEQPAAGEEGEAPATVQGEAPAPGPVLEPPALAPLELDAGAPAPEAKPVPVPEKKRWKLPETVFHLHGYLRMRGGLLKNGGLGHSAAFDRLQYEEGQPVRQNYDPFAYFYSSDSKFATDDGEPTKDSSENDEPVFGGCDATENGNDRCKKTNQVGGDLRFRLKPEIHLSDDIRIKAWIDLLDNVGLGTTGYGTGTDFSNLDLGSAIKVRRAWGEARNRDIGEIRFGRMGADWGLGILDNGGDRLGIDSDFSSDVDRIMGMTNLGGFYFMAAYDWATQGKLMPGATSPSGVPIDRAQRDDMSAVTASIAHKLDPEVQRAALARGEAVFNYGVYFVWRRQLLKNGNPASEADGDRPFYRFNQKQYIPDLWAQFLWEGLRVELEGTYAAGTLEGGCPVLADSNTGNRSQLTGAPEGYSTRYGEVQRSADGDCKFRQFGVALEAEYRLYDDRLGIHFLSGIASGDSNSYGLAATNDPSLQRLGSDGNDNVDGGRTLSTFSFHPDYRVDLILWRTLMRRVSGAYYFKPGVSYDFIHDPYGQVAGARLDAIYSRATNPRQTYGRDANLGLELDLSLYYRSEDGPDLWDGFYTLIQFGILFPFQGLNYPENETSYDDAPKSKNAISFRGVMGIQF